MAENFKIADLYAEVHLDDAGLRRDVGRLGAGLKRPLDEVGEDSGGVLAQGIRSGLIRKSPLIAAAIGGALAAGAPLMLTAATGLFAGIGIIAAAQSEKVKSAWISTWDGVKEGAQASASAIEPVLVQMAARVGNAFDTMRPQLTEAFTAAAPQIAIFTEGIIDLAQNALPGLVRAVEEGVPVTRGFAEFLAKTGTGLSDFFDRITAHGPAAGQVWSSLGDIMGTLLPILGELLGQGAELAAVVLPMLSTTLGGVLNVLTLLGPALPIVAAGFGAFKIVSLLNGPLATFGTTLSTLAARNLPGISAAAGGAGAALGKIGSALPIIGAAFALFSVAAANNEKRINAWASAMLEGGAAATEAQRAIANPGLWDKFTYNLTHWGNTTEVATAQQREATKAYREQLAAMSPLEQAQVGVTQATNRLAEVTGRIGPTARQSREASEELTAAQAELARQQANLEMATHGATQAMIDQTNQAMGAIDADFAYQDALDQLEDKQLALTEAIRDHGAASEEASDAQRIYSEQIWDTAQKAAAASPELAGLKEGTIEYDRAVQNLTLKSLVDMRAGLGPEMQATVDGMIAKLQAGGASLDAIGEKAPMPVVDADIQPLLDKGAIGQQILDALDGRLPLPGLDLNTGPFNGKTQTSFGLLDVLDGQRPTPIAGLNDQASPGLRNILGWINSLYNKNILITTTKRTVVETIAKYGSIRSIDHAVGGVIRGPGTGTSDSIPAMLSNGEYIIRAAMVRKYGMGLFNAVNAGRLEQRASGGAIGGGNPVRLGGRAYIAPNRQTDNLLGGSHRTFNVPAINVHVHGDDLSDRVKLKRMAESLWDEFKRIEREYA